MRAGTDNGRSPSFLAIQRRAYNFIRLFGCLVTGRHSKGIPRFRLIPLVEADFRRSIAPPGTGWSPGFRAIPPGSYTAGRRFGHPRESAAGDIAVFLTEGGRYRGFSGRVMVVGGGGARGGSAVCLTAGGSRRGNPTRRSPPMPKRGGPDISP